MIFSSLAVHHIPNVDNTGADGSGISGNRRGRTGLDKLNFVAFRVLRLKPTRAMASSAQFPNVFRAMSDNMLSQCTRIRRVIRNAAHPADGMFGRQR